jgi:hypothetical protein
MFNFQLKLCFHFHFIALIFNIFSKVLLNKSGETKRLFYQNMVFIFYLKIDLTI